MWGWGTDAPGSIILREVTLEYNRKEIDRGQVWHQMANTIHKSLVKKIHVSSNDIYNSCQFNLRILIR